MLKVLFAGRTSLLTICSAATRIMCGLLCRNISRFCCRSSHTGKDGLTPESPSSDLLSRFCCSPHDCLACCDILGYDRARADCRVIADPNVFEYGRARANENVLPDRATLAFVRTVEKSAISTSCAMIAPVAT